jgi:hypothetical protein
MIVQCPYSTLKNLEDAFHHSPEFIKPEVKALRDKLASELEIDIEEYSKIRRREHELEDKLKLEGSLSEQELEELKRLRQLRKEIERGGCEGIVEPTENPNPTLSNEEAKCEWRVEVVNPRELFEEESFRTLCPECPQARCALCPSEKACATRIIVGCPKGYWDPKTKRCLTSTKVHIIYHGSPKPWKGK